MLHITEYILDKYSSSETAEILLFKLIAYLSVFISGYEYPMH